MKNATRIILCSACVLSLIRNVLYSYKIDNITIKKGLFSDPLERTVKKINKHIQNRSDINYDVCKYKKIPKLLIERNKLKDNTKVKYIVGIENTCDDTCICILDSNLNIIKNVIISHFKIVHKYGGVYPYFISSINHLFLKPYVEKTLEGIDAKKIDCIGFSTCPGIAKNIEATKNYIEEMKKKNEHIKVSSVNHIFAHVLSPLFFHVYNDRNTYTNSREYKGENDIKSQYEHDIDMNISETVKNDKIRMEKIKDIIQVLNNNTVTKQKMTNLSQEDFLKYGNYLLKKHIERDVEEMADIKPDIEITKNDYINIDSHGKNIPPSHKTQENEVKIQGSHLRNEYICVLVSGGSTEIYKVQKNKKNDINVSKLSQTVDISIGDIIDKIARLLELPVGLGGGPFLEKKSEEFVTRMKKQQLSEEACEDPFKPFPAPFSSNNKIDFSFSGLYNHMRKIILELKKGKSFECEKDRYAYYSQRNIFQHLQKQVNKIMYFSELHFNIKNLFIVGGVGCNNFLFQSLRRMAMDRNKLEVQLNEFNKLKKRIKKRVRKIGEKNFVYSKISKDILKNEEEFSASLAWNIYLKFLLKEKTEECIMSASKSFNFEDYARLKEAGSFLLQGDLPLSKSTSPWSVYKTPRNLSRDNAAMICFNTFLNLHNETNMYDDISQVEIKPTVIMKLENNFLLFSDIIIFDVFLHNFSINGK
ncbi:tRNA N6-adenosine threonylcarbamoyltransferase [Plasmodium gonderi]|uniref:tRNA N6-adenosine threonylcarbamoyltransferase n=1 Tax=Plasmodium gonderi TaxID=77519 RepID=A0A1Y1JC72_PLAGO|nr:tRNA N6-adenosine threonylcarbamoyltransferase [Plasmodium gonderi]GAW79268.1 tRNA N6-adenosine threonylcarbamoyltransferase [Plasmodium gonderi]